MSVVNDGDLAPYTLLESICWKVGEGMCHLRYHLERLRYSCVLCHYRYDEAAVLEALDRCVAHIDRTMLQKIRLLYGKDGVVGVESVPYEPVSGVLRLKLQAMSRDAFSADQFRCKFLDSPLRTYYNQEIKRYPTFFDVIFYDNGLLMEGAKSNVYLEVDGRVLTPSLKAGALPGTYRQLLLSAGLAQEASISVSMLSRCDSVYVSNAMIGVKRGVFYSD